MGGAYEKRTGTTTATIKYYSFGGQTIMNDGTGLMYFLTDHLGSVVAITNASGALVSQQRYLPFGQVRTDVGTISQTDLGYTGQRAVPNLGLMDYRARFMDNALGRFIQPDTITPGGPQGLNRYSYVRNNPIRYNDPSGHTACDEDGNCWDAQGWHRASGMPRLSTSETWKMMIKGKFGTEISDEGGKKWSTSNLELMYKSLLNVDDALNGKLRSIALGWTLKMGEHDNPDKPNSTYSGLTSSTNKNISFFTKGDAAIHQMNIYHEFGHLLDSKNVYTNALEHVNNPSFITGENGLGYVNQNALIEVNVTTDLNYTSVQAIQASNNGVSEQWADVFGNYVAGNINTDTTQGSDMYDFVTGVLPH